MGTECRSEPTKILNRFPIQNRCDQTRQQMSADTARRFPTRFAVRWEPSINPNKERNRVASRPDFDVTKRGSKCQAALPPAAAIIKGVFRLLSSGLGSLRPRDCIELRRCARSQSSACTDAIARCRRRSSRAARLRAAFCGTAARAAPRSSPALIAAQAILHPRECPML